MEVGSSSHAVSASPGASDSLHGLKFGQKIYFEDAGNGGAGSSSTAAARKGKNQGAAQPPRCQVQGCMVDLSNSKAYYSRHKVCGMHSKSPKVVVAGLEQRFCQQCSRFHQLPEFDHGKRSCRRKLAGHNERRRKPPAAPLLSRTGRILSSFHGDNSRPSCSVFKGVWPAISFGVAGHNRPVTAHQWQEGFSNAHFSMPPLSPGKVLLSSSGEVLQGQEYLTEDSESSCALSLLSSQTWDTTTLPQTVISNSCMSGNTWSFKDHCGNESGCGGCGCSRSHMLRNVIELNRSQLSGELEQLGFEEGSRNMELEPGRYYCNSHDGINHWSSSLG